MPRKILPIVKKEDFFKRSLLLKDPPLGGNVVVILLLIFAGLLNFVGSLAPELGFDALWYHLTIPKLYLAAGEVFHIPGGLLYYSAMPRLPEILYLVSFKLFPEIAEAGPHLLNWAAGVWVAILIYKLSRKVNLSPFYSLLASLVFYATPLVGWLSGSAYIDLTRTFFEVLALYLLLDKRILLSGLVLGLAISTKTLAIGSLLPLLVICYLITKNLRSCIVYLVSCILVAAPWFVSSYLTTGYPFYPIGSGGLDPSHNIVAFQSLIHSWGLALVGDYWKIFITPDDPISPVFVIIIPFLLLNIRKLLRPPTVYLLVYSLLAYLVWWVIPRTGGGRFILPYLPVMAVVVGVTVSLQKVKLIRQLLIGTIIFISVVNIAYRLAASRRMTPFLLGHETKTAYLCHNLDFTTEVMVDCDGWLAQNIKPIDLVFVSGVHNLYYLNFPFVDETWYAGQKVNYLLIQGPEDAYTQSLFPKIDREPIYTNAQTNIIVYKLHD